MSEPVSVGLAAILEIRNAALDHKKTCDHNCNVSLGGLKRAAELLVGHCYASELPQAHKWIADMPIVAAFLAVLLLAAPVYAQSIVSYESGSPDGEEHGRNDLESVPGMPRFVRSAIAGAPTWESSVLLGVMCERPASAEAGRMESTAGGKEANDVSAARQGAGSGGAGNSSRGSDSDSVCRLRCCEIAGAPRGLHQAASSDVALSEVPQAEGQGSRPNGQLVSEPAHSHFPEYVVIAANAADLGSTIYALHNGAREANPMLGSQLATIAPLKVLGAAAQVLTVRRLKASGHPTAAKITTVFIGSLYLALSVHNVKVGNR